MYSTSDRMCDAVRVHAFICLRTAALHVATALVLLRYYDLHNVVCVQMLR
jgi:hypothetical protein